MKVSARELTAIALLLVASTTLVTPAAARPAAAQRVVIEQRLQLTAATGSFVLRVLERGALARDSGPFGHRAGGLKNVALVSGQGTATHILVTEFTGKRGMFALRQRFDVVSAGHSHMVATGTWKVAVGTGVYAGLTGHGRLGAVITAGGAALTQLEGYFSSADLASRDSTSPRLPSTVSHR